MRQRLIAIAPLAAIVLLGFALRAVPVAGHQWPVGDGGLFYAMVGDLLANGLAIPKITTFDHAGIPFAYPPLAFELAAVVEGVTGLTRADVFRWLPLTLSTLCIPAVFLVANEVQRQRRTALFAALVYATVPYAWSWLTMGSGLTRSAGMLAALLATWRGFVLIRRGAGRDVLATGFLAAVATLCHPEAAVFVLIALAARLLTGWTARGAVLVALAAAATAVLVVPWVAVVVAMHGLAPFLSAAMFRRDPVASVVVYVFAFFLLTPIPLAAALDAIGQVHTLARRRPFLVLWRAALCLLDLRFALVSAVVPLSLLAAEGLFGVVVPAAGRIATRLRGSVRAAVVAATIAAACGGLVISALAAPSVFLAPHTALSPADVAALTWIRDHQPEQRRFVVLATATWGSDDLSEWFPALSERASLDTSQGLEWVPAAERAVENEREAALRQCEPAGLECVTTWLRTYGGADAAVYVPSSGSAYARDGDPSAAIRTALQGSPDFAEVYAGPGAEIFVLRNPGP